jgi:hypothetical protein
MMVLVSLLAVGLAVIRYAVTHWGTSEVLTIAPTVLVVTNILAWFQGARRQVFWVGFGLCGWAYLTFTLGSPLAEHLPTAWFLDGLHDRICANHPAPAYDDFALGVITAEMHGDHFRRAGQSVFSLLFALLGGSLATVLIPARAKDGEGPLPPEGSLLRPGWRDVMSGRP